MLPIQVIGMLLGLPEADLESLRDTFYRAQNEGTAEEGGNALAGIAEAAVWFSEYLDSRAREPDRRFDERTAPPRVRGHQRYAAPDEAR